METFNFCYLEDISNSISDYYDKYVPILLLVIDNGCLTSWIFFGFPKKWVFSTCQNGTYSYSL